MLDQNESPKLTGLSRDSGAFEDESLASLAFLDFKSAAREVLSFLKRRVGFDLWMLTRAEDDDWIILQAEDTSYGIATPSVLRWSDSYCTHMVRGNGPQYAPSSDLVPAYAGAAIGKKLDIGAYIGVPLLKSDGTFFGTLCAIDPKPQPEQLAAELPLVRLLSRLLSSILHSEQEVNKQTRLTERAETEALNDPVNGCYDLSTDLFNVSGWWQLLDAEEYRCETYGAPARVFCIGSPEGLPTDNPTTDIRLDEYTDKVSRVLYESTYPEDVIAQTSTGEFAVLAVECNAGRASVTLDRLRSNFQKADLPISIGYASRHEKNGLRAAWSAAKDAQRREAQLK